MHINHTSLLLAPEEQVLQFHKIIKNTIVINAMLAFESTHMLEYQQSIFMDFLTDLVDGLSWDDMWFNEAKKLFEAWLKECNLKIQVFTEKMSDWARFPIHWSLQILVDNDYLASFIWNAWLIIIRQWKLQYMLTNKPHDAHTVDQFSELVEWEVKIHDNLVTCWFDLETYVDKDDVLTIVANAEAESRSFLGTFIDVIATRVDEGDIRYASMIEIDSAVSRTQQKIKSQLDWPIKFLITKLWWKEQFQSTVLFGLIGIVCIFLFYWLINSFYNATNKTFVVEQWNTVIDISIQDIQRDISIFDTIAASSDQKIIKYNEIIQKLDLLTEHGKWVDDVNNYRRLLEEKFLEWFNIVTANNDSFFSDPIYQFGQADRNILWRPMQVFFNRTLSVAWEQWVLLEAINNEQRWVLISAWVDQTIDACWFNLLRTWLYCATSAGFFNIQNQQFQPVNNDDWRFPSNIVGIDRFGSSNMYTLSDDPVLNSWNIFITRYGNRAWSQVNFWAWTNYVFADTEDLAFASEWFSSFAVDWSFLAWSRADRALYQFWRPPNSTIYLEHRKVPLNGWDAVTAFSSNVSIYAHQDFRHVYLFDQDNQTFTVFRSTPHKTNTAFTHNYSLQYFFTIRFAFDEFNILDVFVEHAEQPQLYIMSDRWVWRINLWNYFQQFGTDE